MPGKQGVAGSAWLFYVSLVPSKQGVFGVPGKQGIARIGREWPGVLGVLVKPGKPEVLGVLSEPGAASGFSWSAYMRSPFLRFLLFIHSRSAIFNAYFIFVSSAFHADCLSCSSDEATDAIGT